MKIADFFAAVGIKVTGAAQLDKIDATLRSSAANATTLVENLAALQNVLVQVKTAAVEAQKGIAGATKEATAANQQVTQTATTATKALNQTQQTKQQVAQQAKKATAEVGKMTAAVTGLSTALVLLVRHGMQTGVWLKNFVLQTGLSSQALQQWAYAARVNDVSAGELTETLKGLQTLQAQIAQGLNNDLRPWTMLGLSPSDDPTKILEDLRKNLKDMPVDIARMYTQQLGISDAMFQFLRNSNKELQSRYRIHAEEQKNLVDLNRSWQSLAYKFAVAKDKLVAVMAVPLRHLIDGVERILDAITWVVDLLGRIPVLGGLIRTQIQMLTVLFVVFLAAAAAGTAVLLVQKGALLLWSAAATGAAVSMSALTASMKSFVLVAGMAKTVMAALAVPAAIVAAKVAVFVGLLAGAVVIAQDLNSYMTGGRSMFEELTKWMEKSPLNRAIVNILGPLRAVIETIKFLRRLISDPMESPGWLKKMSLAEGGVIRSIVPGIERFLTTPKASSMSNNVQQTNKVDVHIDGAQDPKKVGVEVERNFRRTLSDAAYQIPLPSY